MLTRADEPGDECFLILDGTASVDVATETRGPLRPGAFFGEMSLLDGGPRSATIVAETPVRLLVLSRRNFSMLLKEVPGLTQSLLVTLSRRVRQAEESAERMGARWLGYECEGGTPRTPQGQQRPLTLDLAREEEHWQTQQDPVSLSPRL